MSKRVLTQTEEQSICFDYAVGYSIRMISASYGVSRSTIHRVLVRNGVETDRGKKTGR